jgi:hypothetical protein
VGLGSALHCADMSNQFEDFPAVESALRDVKLIYGILPTQPFTKHDLEMADRFDIAAELERVKKVRQERESVL